MCLTQELSQAERLKFVLFDEGVLITDAAQTWIDERNDGRPMTPSDYASTSGIILELDGDVWVNAPVTLYNPNFVTAPSIRLDADPEGLFLAVGEEQVRARFWLPPSYHDHDNHAGEPYNSYGFTHTDRVRVSPVEGCAITCRFCDLPYEFRYRTKRVEGIVDTVATALGDPIQPAHHVLISGGTPRPDDYDYVNEVYESVATTFPDTPVDVMMVPMEGLLDPTRLREIGIHELSINIEVFNQDIARKMMPRKHSQGRETYLDFIEDASEVFGPGRVRSMLMVGLEPMDDTLEGVAAVARRGGVPVLSPFRPDPATPLRERRPPDARTMQETYLRALEITRELDAKLGPACIPCTHNTLTLADTGTGDASVRHGEPHLV